MDTRRALGERLWELREQRGWSQKELAREAGLSHVTVAHLETGKVEPRLPTLRKLARTFDMTVEQLTAAEPEVPPLVLAAMFQEEDEDTRRKALEAATTEEIARYLRDIDRAVTAAGRQLRSPEHQHPGDREGLAAYMQRMLDLREQAEPYADEPPMGEGVTLTHASVSVV